MYEPRLVLLWTRLLSLRDPLARQVLHVLALEAIRATEIYSSEQNKQINIVRMRVYYLNLGFHNISKSQGNKYVAKEVGFGGV